MNEFIRAMDGLPKLVKILLAIPCLDIIWVIYRLVKSINANDMIFLIVAVLLIVIGLPWLWLVDIITLIINMVFKQITRMNAGYSFSVENFNFLSVRKYTEHNSAF